MVLSKILIKLAKFCTHENSRSSSGVKMFFQSNEKVGSEQNLRCGVHLAC